jgi:hypothetical protein
MDEGAQLLVRLTPLALGAAVSPALLGASLGILSTGARGARLLVAYLAGSAVVVAAVLGLTAYPAVHSHRSTATIADVVDLVLAGVLVALAVGTAVRPRSRKARASSPLSSRAAGIGVFGLGIAMMLTDVSTLVLILAGGRDISEARVALAWEIWSYALLSVAALAPILGPRVWRLASPQRSQRGLAVIDAFFTKHGKPIAIAVCLGTAAYLTLRGFGIL